MQKVQRRPGIVTRNVVAVQLIVWIKLRFRIRIRTHLLKRQRFNGLEEGRIEIAILRPAACIKVAPSELVGSNRPASSVNPPPLLRFSGCALVRAS
jgi:hypothetical protein